MKISKIKIKNFRSIEAIDINLNNFNTFVGQNNHGKTNFFAAIAWFDSAKKSDISDFRSSSSKIEVEITYSGVQDGLASMQNEKNRKSIQNLLGELDEVVILKTSEDHKRCFIINGVQTTNPAGFDTALNDFLPKLEYIEATARLSDVSQYKSSTPMGQMLGGVLTAIIENDPRYTVFKNTFDQLFDGEDSTARKELDGIGKTVESFLEKQFPDGTKIKFSIESPLIEDLLKNFETEVDDGVNTNAKMKGDGMQRAIMLAIIQTYAKFRRDRGIGKNFTFLLDEAELHLHPSAQRLLKESLMEIVSAGDQVFLNTHSPVLIAGDSGEQAIFQVYKEKGITAIHRISENEKQYVVYELLGGNPMDLLLPRNFLIVEGHTESQFLKVVIQRFYPEYGGIHILAANGDNLQQERSMNAINQIYAPLATTKSPVYKERLVILCDRCHITKENDYNKFIAGYKLEENTDIFILPVGSIEEYYPGTWKKTVEQVKQMDKDEGRKVKYACEVANKITKEEFEKEMGCVLQALKSCEKRAF